MTLHVVLLPLADEAHEEVASELAVQHLGEEVEVGNEGSLQDDRDVGGVEELDRVGIGLSSDALVLQVKLNSEALLKDRPELLYEVMDKIEEMMLVGQTSTKENWSHFACAMRMFLRI